MDILNNSPNNELNNSPNNAPNVHVLNSWNLIDVIEYIKIHYIQFLLLFLVIIIVYVIDYISYVNVNLYGTPTFILNSQNLQPSKKSIKNNIKKKFKSSKG
jgi:hypothetical protein